MDGFVGWLRRRKILKRDGDRTRWCFVRVIRILTLARRQVWLFGPVVGALVWRTMILAHHVTSGFAA
jgi:hypothetical protein